MTPKALLVLLVAVLALPSAQAGFSGQTVTATGTFLGPSSAVVGDGVEFRNGMVLFDFSDDKLTLSLDLPPGTVGGGWGALGTYLFSGFADTSLSMAIDSNVGFSGSLLTNYSFATGSVSLSFFSGNACCGSDARLVYSFQPTAVPEPSTTALLLFGVCSLGLARRLRFKSPQSIASDA
jgi:PEP-CTERM motif